MKDFLSTSCTNMLSHIHVQLIQVCTHMACRKHKSIIYDAFVYFLSCKHMPYKYTHPCIHDAFVLPAMYVYPALALYGSPLSRGWPVGYK